MDSASVFPIHRCYSEPELLFHPTRDEDRHAHPLHGLLEFGPFSRSLVNCVIDPIRVAIIAPINELKHVDKLFIELEQHHRPRERARSHGEAVRARARPAPAEPDRICERRARFARPEYRPGQVSAV